MREWSPERGGVRIVGWVYCPDAALRYPVYQLPAWLRDWPEDEGARADRYVTRRYFLRRLAGWPPAEAIRGVSWYELPPMAEGDIQWHPLPGERWLGDARGGRGTCRW